jgi:phosphate/sulfate permease
MTLWMLLESIVFFIAVIGALDSAKRVGVVFGGYALAIIAGLVVGACCALAMSRLGRVVGTRVSKLQPMSRQRWYFRALYASGMLWIFLAAILGKWIALGLLRLVA